MTTIARLYKDAELDIAGEINERLPKVTNGLLFNLPMDGSLMPETVGRNYQTKANEREWYTINATISYDTDSIMGDVLIVNRTSDGDAFVAIHNINTRFTAGEVITFSAYVRTDGDVSLRMYGRSINSADSNSDIITLTSTWQKYSFTFVSGGTGSLGFRSISSLDTFQVAIEKIKVELGDTPSPWTPAPEDVQSGIVTTNCNLTNDGIYVEEGTTNLIGDHSINLMSANGWNFANHTNSGYSIKDPLGNNSILWNVDGGFIFLDVNTSLINVNNNYTFSIYIYANKDFTFHYRWSSVYKKMFVKANTWTRLINTQTYVSGTTFGNRFLIGYRTDIDNSDVVPNNFQVAYSMAQLEEKPYATSFTKDTRPNSSNGVQVPTSYFQFPFSVTMEVIPDIKDGSHSVYGTEPQVMYIATLWKPKGGGDFFGTDLHTLLRNQIKDTLINGFKYTMIFRSTGYDIYINNMKTIDNTHYYTTPFNLSDIPMFTVGCRGYEPQYGYANALYRNIAFYNRELTQDDINKLCNNKFSITKEGNINGLELIEDGGDNLVGKFNFLNGTLISLTSNSKSGWGLKMPANGNYFGDFGQLNLKQNTNYIVSYVAWIDSDTITSHWIDNDLFPDGLPQINKIITNIPKRYTAIFNSNDIRMQNCQLRFFNDTGTFNAVAYITDIKFQEVNMTKMSINRNEIHLNELSEGGVS